MSAETEILSALEDLLGNRCAEILLELEETDGERVPPLEIPTAGTFGSVRLPVALLSIVTADLSEKDRIIKNERYLVTVTITVEGIRPTFACFRYADALVRGLRADPTLGGIAASATLIKKDYRFPPVEHGGEPYRAILSVGVVREGF